MNLYLLTQKENTGYDIYDSIVVAAVTTPEAKKIHPREGDPDCWNKVFNPWASSPNKVKAKLIGVAHKSIKKGVVLASFNAG